jgi:hypothetical protein
VRKFQNCYLQIQKSYRPTAQGYHALYFGFCTPLGGRNSVVIRYGMSIAIPGGKKGIYLPKTPNRAELGYIQFPVISTVIPSRAKTVEM